MRKKFLSVVWLLIGFMILGYNIYVIDQLYQPPVISTPELSELKGKLNSLTFLNSKKKKKAQERNQLFKTVFKHVTELKSNKKSSLSDVKIKEKVILPVVQGMIKSIDQKGRLHKLVMIDGKVYSEKQKVKGFVIEKILDSGIYLTKHEKKWFVKIPDVKFSIINE